MIAIDTNSDCTNNVSDLLKRGVTAVGRYFTTYHPSYQLKKSEARALIKGGISLFVVFENCANPVLDEDHGRADAKLAMKIADGIGQPEKTAIYFAAEGLPDGYHQDDVKNAKAYFGSIEKAMAGRFKLGVYSNGLICDALLSAKLCDYAWLSASMAFDDSKKFYADKRWAIAQKTPVDQNWNGLSVDVDEVNGDFGAFSALRQI